MFVVWEVLAWQDEVCMFSRMLQFVFWGRIVASPLHLASSTYLLSLD
jgi:hypothetical protein